MLKKITKMLENYDVLKIISLFLAVILFITINPVFSNPIWNNLFESSQIVNDIPINVTYDTSNYYINGIPSEVNVVVEGNENDVNDVVSQADTLVGSIDLTGQEPGTYTISTDLVSFNLKGANISVQQEDFNITVQERINKEMSVTNNFINGDLLSEGILLDDTTLSPTTVNVRGGNIDVTSVTSVVALTDLTSLELSSDADTDTIDVPLVALDAEGVIVSEVTLDPDTVEVSQDYRIQTIKLPVNYEYINNDTGLFVSSACPIEVADCNENYTQEANVYGDFDTINSLTSITYQLDLTGIDETGGEVTGKPILDANVFLEDTDEKEYIVTLEKGTTKTIENVSIQITNLDSNFTATAANDDIAQVDVTVKGPESDIEQLTASDLIVYVDLDDITQAGIYDVDIDILKDKNFEYTLSSDELNLKIDERDDSAEEDFVESEGDEG